MEEDSDSRTLATLHLAKVSQLSETKGWLCNRAGEAIDWWGNAGESDPPPAERVIDFPPVLTEAAFKPAELLGNAPAEWERVFSSLSPHLPAQLHLEPRKVASSDSSEGIPPIFGRAVAVLRSVPAAAHVLAGSRLRLKLRLSPRGKFIHRNRKPRRGLACVLSGEQTWLFVDATAVSDRLFTARTSDNWNGFRSERFPASLSPAQMHDIAKEAEVAGLRAIVMKVRAGGMLSFNGQWWHATSYDSPVLSLFCIGGTDMESAHSEHKRRMKMKRQKKLPLASFVCNKAAVGGSSERNATHALCTASYVMARLMHGALYGVLATMLVASRHPDARRFKAIAADMDTLKVAHLAFAWLLPVLPRVVIASPRLLPRLFCATTVLFAVGFVALFSRVLEQSGGGGDGGAGVLVPWWLWSILAVHALLLQATDLATDALCRSHGTYLQPVRNVGAVLCIGAALVQSQCAGAAAIACALLLGVVSVAGGAFAAVRAELLVHEHGGNSGFVRRALGCSGCDDDGGGGCGGALPLGFATLFLVCSLVGDNGEQILDSATNYKIDEALAGGKSEAFAAKQLINLTVHLGALCQTECLHLYALT